MGQVGLLMRRKFCSDINILEVITGELNMTIHYLDPNAGLIERLNEIFWITILYIGYPIFNIIEWMHWEIHGHGPRKEAKQCKKIH